MTALGAYFIYPLLGTLISAGIVLWGIGEPIKLFMSSMNEFLASMAGASKMVLGTILGGMTAFDMGGPINKVATLFAQTQVDTQPWLMGGVGIAICTPPLGMALATFLFKTSSLNKSKRQVKQQQSWVLSVSLRVLSRSQRMTQCAYFLQSLPVVSWAVYSAS